MASPEERLALLEQQLTVMAHQLLAVQLQNAELAAAVYQRDTPQARAAPRHSDFNVGATYGVPANFGGEPENVEGSATTSEARIGAPSSRPTNRRSKKLRDRSRQRAERSAAAAVSDSERERTGRDGGAHVCTHCHGTGLIATDCWTRAGGEKVRDRVDETNAGSTAPQRGAGSTAQSATEPMQIAVSDLNMESLFITALDVEDERSAPLERAVPRRWAAAMGALSPTQAREALSSLEVAAPYSSPLGQPDRPNQPRPGDPTSFGRQANQP